MATARKVRYEVLQDFEVVIRETGKVRKFTAGRTEEIDSDDPVLIHLDSKPTLCRKVTR